MEDRFFTQPVLNSPYNYPARHWELDDDGQPTQHIIESRRSAKFITPIPKPRRRRGSSIQQQMIFDEGQGLSTEDQQYAGTAEIVSEIRQQVDRWRQLPNPHDWRVTPETARLLRHWRHYEFSGIRPFFCQVEAVETLIWLTEVAPTLGREGRRFSEHLANANRDANPELLRLALKMATGAGKTTVMAMIIAWQTINALRRPNSNRFTHGFLIVTPGITIKDRLRVLQPNDPDSYFRAGSWCRTICAATWSAPRSSSPTTTPLCGASGWSFPRAAGRCCRAAGPRWIRRKPKARCFSASCRSLWA